MDSLWLAALFAVFIWWFSTGIVLLLDNLPRTTFAASRWASTALAVAALWVLDASADQGGIAAAYLGFGSALLVWGWHELAFLTGWVTGPRRRALRAGVEGWPRFRAAAAAILWHEIAIAAVGVLIFALTWDAPNRVGAWTYAVLWTMRISAKLNLFLGVRNLSEEFLPPHLVYMASFFRRRRMNLLFPVSVTAATVVLVLVLEKALVPGLPADAAVGLTLVATLLGLAILEHWLLVLPLPASALWRWAMRHSPTASGTTAAVADLERPLAAPHLTPRPASAPAQQ
jgi:putative photosynthetic complex assembly protein 2